MATGYVVRENRYYDSVFLMQVAQRISDEPDVDEVAALMGTVNNKQLLADIGFEDPSIRAATPSDLVIAIRAADQDTVERILVNVERWLARPEMVAGRRAVRTLDQALESQPQTNLVVISVPGTYAPRETRQALERGRNVFLFSSNVSVEDELRLKQLAHERGLILMGPDCGTAIIGGRGIGFANVVRSGPIGAIGAAGTGLQEFTSLVHQLGSGVSHAIGTGGRDLSDSVGGLTTLDALSQFEADPSTKVIALVSKPPGPATLAQLREILSRASKPVVACFLGLESNVDVQIGSLHLARTIDEAAEIATRLATGADPKVSSLGPTNAEHRLEAERVKLGREQKFVRGVFAGGTLCYQAQQVMRDLGLAVSSNAPLAGMAALDDPNDSRGHTLVDMGDDLFTRSRPHPMIDATLRNERILKEASDPEASVLLLDFVLGYNASSDPVGDMLGAINEAKSIAEDDGRHLSVVASICGTDDDPQDRKSQIELLESAGILVFPSNAQAAQLAGLLVSGLTA